jgi:nucleoid-associated protein YgaU
MPFEPTPPDQLPTPDEILARLAPQAGEGPTAYITPDDLLFAWQAFLSALVALQDALGATETKAQSAVDQSGFNATLISGVQGLVQTAQAAADAAQSDADSAATAAAAAQATADAAATAAALAALTQRVDANVADLQSLHSITTALTRRVTALENQGTIEPAEGSIPCDIYGGTYPCAHWDSGAQSANPTLDLDDGQAHRVKLVMRTGTSADLVTAGNSPVLWFDLGGSLGHVKGTHADVAASVAKQWIDDESILTVTISKTDPAHPNLVVSKVESVVEVTPP